ncbi:MAG: hypothetical protein HYS18_11280 [Burkholderiales bacterium]|nr:hypothetical protein [Burkholderiales bacterium]
MINPEFKRNLWLQFSMHRLIAMPVLLGLGFFAIHVSTAPNSAETLGGYAIGLFIIIVSLWGTRNASAAIIDEMRDKTWDQQRMSAMHPWTMTWGKLFGATAFNWYGGAICLGVLVTTAWLRADSVLLTVAATMIAVSILMHAIALTLNLHMSRIESRIVQRGGLGGLVILVALLSSSMLSGLSGKTIMWWGQAFPAHVLLLGSSIFFAVCAVFASWRVMSNALQVRTLPWAWPAFACLLTWYAAGFPMSRTMPVFSSTGLIVAGVMTYAALFSEVNDAAVWRRVIMRARAAQWRDALEYMPLWPTTLVLTFAFALAAILSSHAGRPSWPMAESPMGYLPLVLALMLLRDVCVFLFFAFSAKPRRVEGTTLLYLIVINGLLPFLAKTLGLNALYTFLLPFGENQGLGNVAVMAMHAAIAGALVVWRWQKQANVEQNLP